MNDLRILRSLSQAENDVFIWQIVTNHEKQARSARHQQLLDRASPRDSVGDALPLDRNSTFILRSGVNGRLFLLSARSNCSKISEEANVELVYNFRRIKRLVKGPPVAPLDRASAISAEGKHAKIMLFFAINDLESTQLVRP
jgi:hypothetical protein